MEIELNKIYNEDCIVTMKKMQDKSIDYIITSPPYNFGKDAIHGVDAKYTDYKDDLTQEQYFEWQKKLIIEMLRVTKKHIFYNIQMISGNKIALFKLIGYFAENIKELMIWDKLQGEPAMLQGVLNSVYELIIIFSNDEPQKRVFSDVEWRGTQDNIIRNKKNFNNKINHFAVMPLNLPRKLIAIWSKQNDIIYDPFMGSGTTAIACVLEKRNFIGSEISKEYFDIAVNRINNETAQTKLF